MKVKTAILDLGNVVLDWDVDRILGSLVLPDEQAKLLRAELFDHPDWLDLDHGTRTQGEVTKRVRERTGLDPHLIERTFDAVKHSLWPIDETVALMHELAERDVPMYCLSNMARETWDHIKAQDLFTLFEGIVISGQERCMKPHAEIFHLTLNRFGLAPQETLFVDDSLANVQAADRLGIQTHCFKRTADCYTTIRERLL